MSELARSGSAQTTRFGRFGLPIAGFFIAWPITFSTSEAVGRLSCMSVPRASPVSAPTTIVSQGRRGAPRPALDLDVQLLSGDLPRVVRGARPRAASTFAGRSYRCAAWALFLAWASHASSGHLKSGCRESARTTCPQHLYHRHVHKVTGECDKSCIERRAIPITILVAGAPGCLASAQPARRSREVVTVDNRGDCPPESADCATCPASGKRRCEPFASAGPDKCGHFPECCSWCRITWCPNNRARDLYASLHPDGQYHGPGGRLVEPHDAPRDLTPLERRERFVDILDRGTPE